MAGRTSAGGQWLVLGLLCSLGLATPAGAIYLDADQNFSIRARVLSQASLRIKDSSTDTFPTTKAGQLVQHRNFYNPEVEARLTPYTSWLQSSPLSWLAPDDLSVRFAAWGFYDGIYDYGSSQFDRAQQEVNSTYPDVTKRTHAFFLEGPSYDPAPRPGPPIAKTLDQLFPGSDVQNPRDIFAHQRRVNELYFSYSKGPAFLRVGRQAISWGESDTVALLDQNNPFDITAGPPGLFQEVEYARIPLWTVRASLGLFDNLGPLSSGFAEAYWVPGDLDVNTGFFPVLTASPYSPRGNDPQSQVPSLIPIQFVLLDHVPKKRFDSSRWGMRLQTVVNRFFTVSGWYYTHFPNQPVPLSRGLETGPNRVSIFTTETVHELTSVFGVANTFFLEPVDAIVRMEAEYFDNEPAFRPEVNLGVAPGMQAIGMLSACNRDPQGSSKCRVPKADFLRWELGFDRNFFFRALNPTNSFLLVLATVGALNLDETSLQDFRFAGQRKPGGAGTSPDDFVQLKQVEGFAQMQLQTEYMHGRLSPSFLYIQNFRGTYAIKPSVTYRLRDWLLLGVHLVDIGGEYQQLGFYRDRDQISVRVTYQLN